ncbi:hypothetical protein WJX74_007661 [Apatococcus lobatus]|uniref:Glycerophosphocholine acyltransferase 1 n=1 Tax=Apatococcus lobatus TaxID=904363 RepID=A0AAW1RQV7_9CHLO
MHAQQSGAGAKIRSYLKAYKLTASQKGVRLEELSAYEHSQDIAADLTRLAQRLNSRQDSSNFCTGVLLYGMLLYTLGAAPWALPYLYLVFFAVAFPWRTHHFCTHKWGFFLLDFCYWANAAAAAFIILNPAQPKLYAAVYALTDGPLAGALIVWQSAWVFGSASHSISVLMHGLPGLALFMHRHFPPPETAVEGLRHAACHILPARWQLSSREGSAAAEPQLWQQDTTTSLVWSFLLPLGFYALWQLVYFLIVQVACRGIILRNKFETSYSTLAKRAAKSNNFWNRLVRKGSKARRVVMYGLLQAVFTVVFLAFALPLHRFFWVGCLWQVVKIIVPVYYGSRYQCERVPKHAVLGFIKRYRAQMDASSAALMAASQKGQPASH